VIYDMLFEVEGLTESSMLFAAICRGLCDLVQARAVVLTSVDSEKREIALHAVAPEGGAGAVSWGKNAPRVRISDAMLRSFHEHPLIECSKMHPCADALFPEELAALSRMKDVEGRYGFSVIRGGELLGRAMVYLHTGQKLRMKDMIELYLTTAGIVIQRVNGIEDLKESKERFRMIADFTYDWEYWVDEQGQCLYVSPACERISGYKRQDFIDNQQLLLEITHPEDRALVRAHLNSERNCHEAGDEGATSLQFRIITHHGDERWIEHTCQPVYDREERLRGRRGSNHDITEQRAAAIERARLERQVQHTQKLESLGILAGGIAHDFNNLLMGILGNADVALSRLPDDAQARATLESIKQAGKRAADLCSQMLAYAGKGQMQSQIININELIREMTHLLRVSIPRKIQVRYDFTQRGAYIKCDAGQIRQVIMNLITNAADAIGDMAGVIALRTAHITASGSYISNKFPDGGLAPGTYILVEVADTGRGMDKMTQEKLFDPFFTTKFYGHGLGMSSVLGIIKSHHGAIGLDSEPGKGSTFTILFPFVDGLRPTETKPEAPNGETWKARGGTVLVVDDEDFVSEVAMAMLSSFGLSVITAGDGEEAVRVFADRSDEIKAVLMDLTMPNKDGMEAAMEIRNMRADVPIILASGYAETEDLKRFE
ncbi:MAG: PAS domain S-box protein, partial [Spartobacteria bacterium]|nr:PAS domain S-box protein [Spartobacteria bacterium]